MNWDDFWSDISEKNEGGAPKYSVTTDVGTPSEDFMNAWIEKWHQDFSYLDNEGCGCCVNIYEFDVSQEAINELTGELIILESYEELHRPSAPARPPAFGSSTVRSKKRTARNLKNGPEIH